MIEVASYLLPLSKEEIKTLGMLLGLSYTTVKNNYEDSSINKYLDSILSAWFKKQDRVMEEGQILIVAFMIIVKLMFYIILRWFICLCC